jgi:glutathione S-transferase
MSGSVDGSAVVWGPPGAALTDPSLVLWGIGTARALRAHWMLAELGMPYISRRIQSRTGETLTPDYLSLCPRHKIPLLQHGELLLTESAAIVHYLADQYARAADFYVPADAAQRAKVNEWCYFVINELDGHTLYVIRRHLALKHIYGEAPTAVDSARMYFREQVTALEGRFGEAQAYLFGSQLSVADILLATCLDWAVREGIALPDAVMAYRDRVLSRAAYREAARRNNPAVAPPPEAHLHLDARSA